MDWQYTALIATFFGGLLFQALSGFTRGIFNRSAPVNRTRNKLSLFERMFGFINEIIWIGLAVLLGVIVGMKIYEYDIFGKFQIWAAGVSGIVVAVIFWFMSALAYVSSEIKAFEMVKKR